METIKTEVIKEWARIKKEKAEKRVEYLDSIWDEAQAEKFDADHDKEWAIQKQVIVDMEDLISMLNFFI